MTGAGIEAETLSAGHVLITSDGPCRVEIMRLRGGHVTVYAYTGTAADLEQEPCAFWEYLPEAGA